MRALDEINENLIEHAHASMVAARDEANRRYWCERLTYYVGQRSPERIEQMEREKFGRALA